MKLKRNEISHDTVHKVVPTKFLRDSPVVPSEHDVPAVSEGITYFRFIFSFTMINIILAARYFRVTSPRRGFYSIFPPPFFFYTCPSTAAKKKINRTFSDIVLFLFFIIIISVTSRPFLFLVTTVVSNPTTTTTTISAVFSPVFSHPTPTTVRGSRDGNTRTHAQTLRFSGEISREDCTLLRRSIFTEGRTDGRSAKGTHVSTNRVPNTG